MCIFLLASIHSSVNNNKPELCLYFVFWMLNADDVVDDFSRNKTSNYFSSFLRVCHISLRFSLEMCKAIELHGIIRAVRYNEINLLPTGIDWKTVIPTTSQRTRNYTISKTTEKEVISWKNVAIFFHPWWILNQYYSQFFNQFYFIKHEFKQLPWHFSGFCRVSLCIKFIFLIAR